MNVSPLLPHRLLRPLQAGASLLAVLCLTPPALAQVESFMLQRGSKVGPATEIKPTDCVTGPDGSVTCNTVIENPPGETPARPKYQPFQN
ncbi:hypothetical protein [Synechococcus sp. CCY 9618]|uniref:hypothetical protein n=1 Tax=Synechococcus sp. CCY 9618 TaxID=2815602 RepID=UPI001C220381|nr:hypothetical protein [Synechococcus sp. CCY 9618]